MRRTSITAKLLVGVAVTAVSGCVSVEPRAALPAWPEAARPVRAVQDPAPQIVQPPVRESLEALPDPAPSVSPAPAPAGTPAAAPPRPRGAEARAPQQRAPAQPPPRRAPHRRPPVPPAVLPKVPGPLLAGRDVCAIGRGYGSWRPGSTEARTCEEVYGR
ncbi:hypothetical protein [Streptomyces fulvorobeus]|uniref:Lipoprotein n=1 Tax=Streptomyces fulvorobeus TaxID=284028 RepID=A0A7Y9H815_9ACTN|nr:hypothetical protein [Streptomyces fulvorobeus]NYE39615.1 hypothetical protein [Streptomyces fulvorobeus]